MSSGVLGRDERGAAAAESRWVEWGRCSVKGALGTLVALVSSLHWLASHSVLARWARRPPAWRLQSSPVTRVCYFIRALYSAFLAASLAAVHAGSLAGAHCRTASAPSRSSHSLCFPPTVTPLPSSLPVHHAHGSGARAVPGSPLVALFRRSTAERSGARQACTAGSMTSEERLSDDAISRGAYTGGNTCCIPASDVSTG